MALKGNDRRKSISHLGSIVPNGNGWRAQSRVAIQDDKYGPTRREDVYGPTRQHKRDARADLERARAVQTRKEYCEVLSQLTIAVRQERVGSIAAHGKGWRVNVTVKNQVVHGPYRVNKSDAVTDLQQIRTGETREECRSILLNLKKGNQSITRNATEEEAKSRKRRVRVSRLGIISPHGNGWRVAASPVDGRIVGPCRMHESEADADLKHCRAAKTREEYRSNLIQLKLAAAKQAVQEYRDTIRRLRKIIQTLASGENNEVVQTLKYARTTEHDLVSEDGGGN